MSRRSKSRIVARSPARPRTCVEMTQMRCSRNWCCCCAMLCYALLLLCVRRRACGRSTLVKRRKRKKARGEMRYIY